MLTFMMGVQTDIIRNISFVVAIEKTHEILALVVEQPILFVLFCQFCQTQSYFTTIKTPCCLFSIWKWHLVCVCAFFYPDDIKSIVFYFSVFSFCRVVVVVVTCSEWNVVYLHEFFCLPSFAPSLSLSLWMKMIFSVVTRGDVFRSFVFVFLNTKSQCAS